MAGAGREHEGGCADIISRIHFRSGFEQDFHALSLTALGGTHQCGEVAIGSSVHVGAGLQKLSQLAGVSPHRGSSQFLRNLGCGGGTERNPQREEGDRQRSCPSKTTGHGFGVSAGTDTLFALYEHRNAGRGGTS